MGAFFVVRENIPQTWPPLRGNGTGKANMEIKA